MMTVFIPWDIYFTKFGIWGFNPSYLCGIEFLGLPIEEWLFFIVVPYATVFIYECIKAYFPSFSIGGLSKILLTIVILLFTLSMVYYDRWYTLINFLGSAIVLIIALWSIPKNLSKIMLAYIVSLLPFLLVNGILTGSFLSEPIVWYNDNENMGVRIFTIPLEDSIYFLFFFFLVIIPYEKNGHHS